MGFSLQTIITDILSALGFAILFFGPVFYSLNYKKFLKRHLFTKEDGAKIFEKLKYDLRVDKIEGVNRTKVYRDLDYALTIFKNSMEYNKRDLIHYFNELQSMKILKSSLLKKSWLTFLVWALFFVTCFSSSGIDIISFMFNGLLRNSSDNGYSSIVFLFGIAILFNSVILVSKYFTFQKKMKNEIRKINLVKYEKVMSNFKYIFIGEIVLFLIALFLILLNTFF